MILSLHQIGLVRSVGNISLRFECFGCPCAGEQETHFTKYFWWIWAVGDSSTIFSFWCVRKASAYIFVKLAQIFSRTLPMVWWNSNLRNVEDDPHYHDIIWIREKMQPEPPCRIFSSGATEPRCWCWLCSVWRRLMFQLYQIVVGIHSQSRTRLKIHILLS